MISRTRFLLAAMATFLAAATGASAQDNKPKLMTLGVDESAATKALADTCGQTGQARSLALFTDALNQHLLHSFDNTKKFKIVARGDLSRLLKEQDIPVNVIRAPDGKAAVGKIAGLDRLVVVTLTDFSDSTIRGTFVGAQQTVMRRTVQATAMVKIYDTTEGNLVKSIPVRDLQEVKGVGPLVGNNVVANDAPNNAILDAVATNVASRGAQQVLEFLFPCKVVSVLGDQVTLNRGENTEIAVGQVWIIYGLGEIMRDPDTGEELGREEVKIGEVVVEEVQPKVSKCRVQGTDRGIARDSIARLKRPAAAPAVGGPAGR